MLKNFITNLVLRSIGSNLDHLIDFLAKLDSKIDAYVAAQDAEAQQHNHAIVDAGEQLSARIDQLKAEHAETVTILADKATQARARANVASTLKRIG